jgi:glutathione S-transferase
MKPIQLIERAGPESKPFRGPQRRSRSARVGRNLGGVISKATLIGVPGSHPVMAVELMLRYKGIPYRRRDLPTYLQAPVMRLLGYRSATVPVARLDGTRVVTSTAIAHALDELHPEPPLFERPEIERAEAWAERNLQQSVRQLVWWAITHDRPGAATFLEGSRLGLPSSIARLVLRASWPLVVRRLPTSPETLSENLAALGRHLDHVDALIAEGVIGRERPNAADFHIAASVRLAMCLAQLHRRIAERPAGRHALQVCPDSAGTFGAVIPEDLLADTDRIAS